MCGIGGFLHFDKNRPVSWDRLRTMTDVLQHRGPDSSGYWVDGPIALGHRRLAIIDVQSGGQPMFSADGSLVLIFNGEIYNYIELRDELEKKGYIFHTASDTEVILVSYTEWGIRCVEKFNGMWAFALWDKREQRLFCSRDRLGEKPFFYTIYDKTFVFGSEIKALFAYGVTKYVNESVLDAYLCFTYIPAPHTFYKNIFKLMPGHSVIIEDGQIKIDQYWEVKFPPEESVRQDEGEILSEFDELFQDSVRIRMRSDVEFGAFLSGGLDSGSVVANMSKVSLRPVKTFTIGFAEPDFDERDVACLTAQQFKTDHMEYTVAKEDMSGLIQKLAWHYDEPFGDSSALPTYLVSKIAREEVKMVLTGDGGDEVLSGYTILQGEKFSQKFQELPEIIRQSMVGLLKAFENNMPPFISRRLMRPRRVVENANLDFIDRLEAKQSGFSRREREYLLNCLNKDYLPARTFIEDAIKPIKDADNFSKLNYWLLKVSLPDDMLCKVDRASMANSLEIRVPFLDYRLVELLSAVSMSVKLKGYTRKYILRQTVGKELPSIVLGMKKRGFSIPINHWLRGDASIAIKEQIKKLVDVDIIQRKALLEIMGEEKLGQCNNGNNLWILGMLGYAL